MPRSGAGEPDDGGGLDEPDAPDWALTFSIVAVVLVGLVVGLVALIDGTPATVPIAGLAGVGPEAASNPSSSGTSTGATATTGPPTTSSPATTSPATTATPTTATPTSVAAAVPPTTAPPAGSVMPDGWTRVVDTELGFSAELPATPVVRTPSVPGAGGPTVRTEYDVGGPDGSKISITSIEAPGATPEDAAEAVRRDLAGVVHLGEPTAVDGAPARSFSVDFAGGSIHAFVAADAGRLVTVSMFTRRLTPASTLAFERVVRSLRLRLS